MYFWILNSIAFLFICVIFFSICFTRIHPLYNDAIMCVWLLLRSFLWLIEFTEFHSYSISDAKRMKILPRMRFNMNNNYEIFVFIAVLRCISIGSGIPLLLDFYEQFGFFELNPMFILFVLYLIQDILNLSMLLIGGIIAFTYINIGENID